MFRRLATATVTVGLLAATVSGVTMATAGHGTANAASAATAAAAPAARGGNGGLRALFGAQLARVARRHRLPIVRVSAVNGSTINATTIRGSVPVTITVSATTAYTEAGASASLSDVHTGTILGVAGTRTGARTLTASKVVIVLPRVAGVVTAVNGSTLTVTGRDAMPHQITLTSSTRILRGGQIAAASDIATGTALVAEGTLNADGSLTAVRVRIALPHVAGTITAVNGSTLTVTDFWGTAHTVLTTSSTAYRTLGNVTVTASSLTTGTHVVALGTLGSDGKTLTAQRIVVLPKGMGAALRARALHLRGLAA